MKTLTDEQIKLADNNHNLIFGFINSNRLDESDWYGIIAVAFVNAARTYDSSKGAFSTYAYACMYNEMCVELRKRKIDTISLDSYIDSDSENAETFDYYLGAKDDDLEFSPVKDTVMSYYDTLDAKKKIIFKDYFFLGFSVRDIAKKLGVSRQTIENKIKNFRRVLSKKLNYVPVKFRQYEV